MKLLTKCTTLMLAAFLTGCSEETQHAGGNQPEPGGTDDAGRREVLLTLKNKLALKPVATKAETIATADENAIETLDVYVFASESEAGDNYTLSNVSPTVQKQKLHCLRELKNCNWR